MSDQYEPWEPDCTTGDELDAVFGPTERQHRAQVRLSPIIRVDYLRRWRRRLASGQLGEDPDRPRTWVLDGLWRAACLQLRAQETEELLGGSIKVGANTTHVHALHQRVAEEWNAAHTAYHGGARVVA